VRGEKTTPSSLLSPLLLIAAMMSRNLLPVSVAFWLLSLFLPLMHGADEAERQVWAFKTQAAAWGGNGPLKFGVWNVRDAALRLRAQGPAPYMEQRDLRLPAEKANVIQIQMTTASARKCQLWFSTGISPVLNTQKMVEFDLLPSAAMVDYTLDLKNVATWQDQINSLRLVFVGANAGDEIQVSFVKILDGEKISKPLLFTNYRLGEKPVVREFRLGSLFNDQMVLQRDKPVPVWGRARPGETVSVEFAQQKKIAVANPQGSWQVALDAMPASSEPRKLRVSSDVAGHQIELAEVLVGDVWLCGGQSNMGGSPFENPMPDALKHEVLETDYPGLRSVSLLGQHRDTPLSNDASDASFPWHSVAGKSRGPSAVAYFFGQALHASQKVPVGLVCAIKAGSQIEQWMDKATLASVFSDAELSASCTGSHLAGGLFNGMIAPIHPFPIRGAFWYQGESNADNEARYEGYYKSLPAMIRMWRGMWGEDLPVLLAQLPAFDGAYPKDSWARIREVQQLSAQLLPKVWTAVTFDEGDSKNLHPFNKFFVGSRLAEIAKAKVYGDSIECLGPSLKSLKREGALLHLLFEHVGGGLKARGDLIGFEVRGADQNWCAASANITAKDTLTLSSEKVTEPVAARYAWSNAPTATLFNDLALPASPFRSDTPLEKIEAIKGAGLRSVGLEKAIIEVVAGGGTAREGEKATLCKISQPFGIAFDAEDNMFVCEETHRLLRVDAKTGVLTIVTDARKGNSALGDGGPAANASFAAPHNLVSDGLGNLFIADTYHYAVRRVDAKTGVVTTIAGNGTKELTGDDGPAVNAGLDGIACLAFNRDYSKLFLGGFSKVIRVVDMKTSVISTVRGAGGSRAIAVDSKGNLFSPAGRGIRMLSSAGATRLLVDNDAQPPLNSVKHLWVDAQDNILIADAGNHGLKRRSGFFPRSAVGGTPWGNDSSAHGRHLHRRFTQPPRASNQTRPIGFSYLWPRLGS
jgi:sialate O-acetylesterase